MAYCTHLVMLMEQHMANEIPLELCMRSSIPDMLRSIDHEMEDPRILVSINMAIGYQHSNNDSRGYGYAQHCAYPTHAEAIHTARRHRYSCTADAVSCSGP